MPAAAHVKIWEPGGNPATLKPGNFLRNKYYTPYTINMRLHAIYVAGTVSATPAKSYCFILLK